VATYSSGKTSTADASKVAIAIACIWKYAIASKAKV
jgi:hypothetical protein